MHLRFALLIIALFLSACTVPSVSNPTPTLAPGAEELLGAPTTTPVPAPTAAPGSTVAPTATSVRTVARYETANCEFPPPGGVSVECGWLTVPEDRAKPGNGREVRLHVAIFRSTRPNPPPDPIVYLEGGPGVDALERLPLVFDLWFRPFLANRDFILYDQRGAGYSTPSLACPELTKLSFDMLPMNVRAAESSRLWSEAALKCRERLVAEGIDLAQYNTLTGAADLEDLRLALGYEQWNLIGSSYGTRLALTAMREYPQGIRSVVLDSTRPPQINESQTPADAERAFQTLFRGCAADLDCNAAYPDLERVFYDLVEKLNTQPVTLPGVDPFTGRTYEVLINGDTLISTLFQAMYSTEIIPLLPRAIYGAAQKNEFSLWVRLIMNNVSQSDYFSYGVMYSSRCYDEILFETREAMAKADEPFPHQQDVFDMTAFWDICNAWGVGVAPPIENQPVRSAIPALILAGTYDPATPPEDGKEAVATLRNGFFFEFPSSGHGVLLDGGCPLSMALAFLDNPQRQPDAACLAQIGGPAFDVEGAAVRMIPFRDSDAGIAGVTPQGWTNFGQGVYGRPSGDVAIVQMRTPLSALEMLARLDQQFNLDSKPESAGEYRSERYAWQLYTATIRGQPTDIALTEDGGRALLVLMISDPGNRDEMYEQVFLPVLDALRVI
ncbi:alpha/beta fold hydrolase [Roseiflexus castenholzii]|uniref:alpha/beta fold hydrolase n=1 Tax=Roseiflexus castenholzii TaxID=120962 RepID=UPI003C7ED05F